MASEVIERNLYNGLFPTVHNPLARGSSPRYVVMVDGEKTKPKGVTTIIGAVLAKDFVGWALDCMAEALEDKLPVITQADIDDAKLASARKRDAGAGTGTEVHAAVERYLKTYATSTAPIDWVQYPLEIKKPFEAFIKWFKKVEPEVINVEELVYSKEFGYCGTYDCMLKIKGKVYLCDLKTTNASRKAPKGVYSEYFIQLGAYAQAHEEERLYGVDLPKIDGLMVISAKKNGKLDIITNTDVELTVADCQNMFKKVINLYSFLLYTTKKLGGK